MITNIKIFVPVFTTCQGRLARLYKFRINTDAASSCLSFVFCTQDVFVFTLQFFTNTSTKIGNKLGYFGVRHALK